MQQWQSEWAHNKYWVMAHSQQAYNRIRTLARNNDWTPDKQAEYQQIIRDLDHQPPTKATLTTAYQHVWGYLKKNATQAERDRYVYLLAKLTPSDDELGSFLVDLTDQYQVKYLLKSRLIQDLRNDCD
ncbi:YbgA family protein [Nicoliella spurrieriana]|uniref:YbgA family protein n=1 Tax=Nicoliella spurrieriana TaxID=2925830 RepID=A0A976RSY5_9LACO|nr:YbgA family protein [Nicoliella spurrieriana]UQS87335.1 YbgA family protein [Nicoliella spurrieriana]